METRTYTARLHKLMVYCSGSQFARSRARLRLVEAGNHTVEGGVCDGGNLVLFSSKASTSQAWGRLGPAQEHLHAPEDPNITVVPLL